MLRLGIMRSSVAWKMTWKFLGLGGEAALHEDAEGGDSSGTQTLPDPGIEIALMVKPTDDEVVGARRDHGRGLLQIDHAGIDRGVVPLELPDRFSVTIDGGHLPALLVQPDGMAAGTTGDVERTARGEKGGRLNDPSFRGRYCSHRD